VDFVLRCEGLTLIFILFVGLDYTRSVRESYPKRTLHYTMITLVAVDVIWRGPRKNSFMEKQISLARVKL